MRYNGCRFYDSCFTCPFPDCIVDCSHPNQKEKSRSVTGTHKSGRENNSIVSLTSEGSGCQGVTAMY